MLGSKRFKIYPVATCDVGWAADVIVVVRTVFIDRVMRVLGDAVTCLLDANVFIQAKNLHYGQDFCPTFWQWLLDNNAAGRVFSIDKVADDIAAGGDELTDWMQDHGNGLFAFSACGSGFGSVCDQDSSSSQRP